MGSSLKPAINLRGHHFVCLHFFKGEGYAREYRENIREILARAEAGEDIEAASGADDVCSICPNRKGDICFHTEDAEAVVREMDRAALILLGLRNREHVLWSNIQKKLPDIFPEWSGKYCKICGWRSVCEKQEKFLRFANR
jgi:uncharacterized protein